MLSKRKEEDKKSEYIQNNDLPTHLLRIQYVSEKVIYYWLNVKNVYFVEMCLIKAEAVIKQTVFMQMCDKKGSSHLSTALWMWSSTVLTTAASYKQCTLKINKCSLTGMYWRNI